MKKIYFAHSRKTLGSAKEKDITTVLEARGYNVVNPFKKEQNMNKKYGVNDYYDNPTLEYATEIVNIDEKLLKECEEVFCWFVKGTNHIGTSVEMTWGNIHGKKITVLCHRINPFIFKFATVIYASFEDFVKNKPFFKKENNDSCYKCPFKLYMSNDVRCAVHHLSLSETNNKDFKCLFKNNDTNLFVKILKNNPENKNKNA